MAECRHASFTDVDEFVGQMLEWGWQGAVHQTSPGAFRVDLSLYADEGFAAVRTWHSTANLREIQTPGNARTFGIVVPQAESNQWCHQKFDRAILQMMPRTDYVASNRSGHLGYQIAIDDDLIDETLAQLELPENLSRDAHLLAMNSESIRTIVTHLNRIWSGDGTGHPDARQIVIDDLTELVLSVFNRKVPVKVNAPVRSRALKRALGYMEANLGEAITLADIARDTGASRRTLTEAFREGLGVAPMAYLKLLRLNRVRQVLGCSDDPHRGLVAQAANDAGFWHMGQFAADYRRLFGELPSETLYRVSAD